MNAQFARLWTLDPAVTFLNHGSFGACPRAVLDAQAEWRDRMERQPVLFHSRELEGLLDHARTRLAQFVHADPDDLTFVTNATTGVNAVLRSMRFEPGDEILITNHEYNACANVVRFVAEHSGARVVVVNIPLPVAGDDDIIQPILAAVTPRTRLALLDHVTSPTAIVFPVAAIARALADKGVDTIIDGAHAPGMVDLDIPSLGCAYYTANCHKWICAPKGAALLWVRKDKQREVRPTSISHGANSARDDRSRFQIEFSWTGTSDPTPALTVPAAIDTMGAMLPGGWPALRRHNHDTAVRARRILLEALGGQPLCPEAMLGTMAAARLPDNENTGPASPLYNDPEQVRLYAEHKIEVPIIPWPSAPHRLVRVSAQIYNSDDDYESLAKALRA